MTDIINFCNELKSIINYKNIILVEILKNENDYTKDKLKMYGYGSYILRIPRTNFYVGMSDNEISPRSLDGVKVVSLEDKKLENLSFFSNKSQYTNIDDTIILAIGFRADTSDIELLLAPVAETLIYDLKGYKKIKSHNLLNYEIVLNKLIQNMTFGIYKSFSLYCRMDNIIKYTAKSTNYKEKIFDLESYSGYLLLCDNEELSKEEILNLYKVDNISELQKRINK